MSETNLIVALDDVKVYPQQEFVALKGKSTGEIVITLGVDDIPWLHETLNHLYEIRARRL